MSGSQNSARALLDTAYKVLHLDEGELWDATSSPGRMGVEQWIEKGEWLSLASRVKAEKIFFVNNNPVIVFAESEGDDLDSLRVKFNEIWCMARPACLFLARQGELAVYDLSRPPARSTVDWQKNNSQLVVARNIAEVATKLHNYRREQVESGRLFEEEHFGESAQRADQSLVDNLKLVRTALQQRGLRGNKVKYAHALIGRSIFIRYLEDRGILTRDYFEKAAGRNAKWHNLLDGLNTNPDLDPAMEGLLYPRVLQDKDFSYALFNKLARDFNGDMFPSDPNEEKEVKQPHLDLLRGFLLGEAGEQQNLFFWAYKFDIIPIDLISSIYEEFYHSKNGEKDAKGTHYTPSALVEFVLSKILTKERLESKPRIFDAACGSGIFLVEAFRRIVRYRVKKQNGRRLSTKQLREILRDQIAGIEINEEALRIAAFSLYLALLHYQKPPDILKQIERGYRLPNLIYEPSKASNNNRFNNLLCANAFDVEARVSDKRILPNFTSDCADIVIGNPPWGAPPKKDIKGQSELKKVMNWCALRELPVGDEELSQAFIWRTLDILHNRGHAGVLLPTGVFLKHYPKSRQFREEWLKSVKLSEVVNFAHVRDIFFRNRTQGADSIAPFASVTLQKNAGGNDQVVRYWSAKKTAQVNSLQAVILSRPDLHLVRQSELRSNFRLWKTYWWGSHRDAALISTLELFPQLERLYDHKKSSQGYTKGTQPAGWLLKYDSLPTNKFQRYGPIDPTWLEPAPKHVKGWGKEDIYHGNRILVKHGVSQSEGMKGRIISRMGTEQFCFSNSINGFKLLDDQEWKYKILLGIFWSSLARYYFFLTSSKWGLWHFGIHKEEYLKAPIRFPEEQSAIRYNIEALVDKLRAWNPIPRDFYNPEGRTAEDLEAELAALEYDLDEEIFNLYKLTEPERDLVRDMTEYGIDFFYNPFTSRALKRVDTARPKQSSGFYRDLPSEREIQKGLEGYLHAFTKIWNHELEPEGEFQWRIIRPDEDSPLLTVIFSTTRKGEPVQTPSFSDEEEWLEILNKLKDDLRTPYHINRVYVDGMIRAVTATDIIIIKRDECRLWTRSMAREDAEATIVQALNLQDVGKVFSERTPTPHHNTIMG